MNKTSLCRFFLWLGVAAAILRTLLVYAVGFATPGYSARRDYLSEMSALGAPYMVVMNVFSLGLAGVMIILASIGLYRCLRERPFGGLSAILMGWAGLSYIFIALFPCDPGCVSATPELNMRMKMHLLAGFSAMGAVVTSSLVFGIGGLLKRDLDRLRWSGLALGLVGLIAYLLLGAQSESLSGNFGLVQRILQGSGDLWLLIVAWYCLRGASGSATPRD